MRRVRAYASLSAIGLSAFFCVTSAWAQPAGSSATTPPLPPSAPSVPSPANDAPRTDAHVETATPGVMASPPSPVQMGATPTRDTGFSFGSYGRVGIASDLRGRTGRVANITAFGPRLDLPPYAEIQFNYDGRFRDVRWRTVVTVGMNENLFHFTGRFDATFAVRNLYLEAQRILHPGLSVWAGSRMYRGDDVYLLNWWPLDNLNMVGGGARFDLGEVATFQLAVGMNRLDDPYQLQTISVPARDAFGPVTALLLDRPRVITAAKATWWISGRTSSSGMKLSLYGEHHAMASGVRQTNERGDRIELPADSGYTVGAQFGVYNRANFVNLFVRYSQGLGAYGDLRVPAVRDSVRTSERAQEFRAALSANWERGMFAVMAGAYVRYFRDADPGVFSRDALVEGAVVARPIAWFGDYVGLALEASWQHTSYNALDPDTGMGGVRGTVLRFGAVPFFTPAGRGSYTRPHIQLIYLATVRDEGARRLYAPGDPFGFNPVEHYLGVGTEWWFNSSYL